MQLCRYRSNSSWKFLGALEEGWDARSCSGASLTETAARPPACAITDAPLKTVVIMRLKSAMMGLPSAYLSCSGTTVQPKRTPVKPAYLLKLQVSMATSSAPASDQVDDKMVETGSLWSITQSSCDVVWALQCYEAWGVWVITAWSVSQWEDEVQWNLSFSFTSRETGSIARIKTRYATMPIFGSAGCTTSLGHITWSRKIYITILPKWRARPKKVLSSNTAYSSL